MTVDRQLKIELENLALPGNDVGGRIVKLQRRQSEYSSSFPVEDIDLTFENGNSLLILFKDNSKNNMLKESYKVKHNSLYNPEREIAVYRSILSSLDLETAKYYGSVVNISEDRYWLFIEKVPGLEMYQVGEFETWRKVARWLASFHSKFEGRADELRNKAPLLRYDRDFYRFWFDRALACSSRMEPGSRSTLERLLTGYEGVIDRLLQLPVTLLHGDFFASNILAQQNGGGLRICPVDWEMAATGPGYIDLAALTSGQWSDDEIDVLINEYLGHEPGEETRKDIICCQLHLAIQCLGWSPGWQPPREHRQDWLNLAVRLAEKLE